MGFLRKLFGNGDSGSGQADSADKLATLGGKGVFVYPECGKCGRRMKLHIDKDRDLENEGGGYTWHKTLVCNNNRCFQRMDTVVRFDGKLNVIEHELDNGRFLTLSEYDRLNAEEIAAKEAAERAAAEEAAAAEQEGERESAENDTESDDTTGGGERGFG